MDYQLNVLVLGKDEGATELIDKLTSGLKKTGDEADKAAPKSESLFSKFTVTAGDAVHAVQAVVGAVIDIGHSLIDGNAQFEQYNVAYTTLIKNSADFKSANEGVTDSLKLNALASDAAQQHMQFLADFGARTPFDLPGVVQADTVLQGFGLNSTAAAEKFGFAGKDILTIAGDVASGTGSDFKEMSLLIGKFSSGATGEAISRMQELGITNREELKQMGLDFSKSGELLSPLPESMNTVLKLMKEKYGGLMEAQSATFNGMMSNLDDWKGATLRELGEPIFEALKPQLASLLTFLGSSETKQAIHDFATGLGDAVQAVGQVGKVVSDYGIPALEGLTAATVAYGIVALPAAIPAIIASTTAFAAQAVAVAAAVAPLAAIAVSVAAVTKAYNDFNQANADATTQLLESRPWWNASTQAITDYGDAGDYTKDKLSGLKAAVDSNRTELEREIKSLAERKEAGLVSDKQYQDEMANINEHRIAVTASSDALAKQTKALEDLHSTDAVEDLRAMRSGQDNFTQAVQLTDQELKDLQKTFDTVYKEGPQALAQASQTEAQYLDQMAQNEQDHTAKVTGFEQERADKLADIQRDYSTKATALIVAGHADQVAALNTSYQQQYADFLKANGDKETAEQAAYAKQQQDAAIAYAQAEAAQKAHLGQELIDYVQAMAVKDSTFRDRADSLTGEIAKQYGVQQSLASASFGSMLNDIDQWKVKGSSAASDFAQHLSDATDRAADLQHTIDQATTQSVDALTKRFKDGEIGVDAYTAALAKIPSQVVTTVQLNAAVAQIQAGDDGALGRALMNQLPGRASGGDVQAGKAYMVGESGREMFIPSTGGSIIPNASLGGGSAGGGGVHVSVDQIVVNGAQDPRALARDLVDHIQAELLRKQDRNLTLGFR